MLKIGPSPTQKKNREHQEREGAEEKMGDAAHFFGVHGVKHSPRRWPEPKMRM